MDEKNSDPLSGDTQRRQFLSALKATISNPIHLRIVEAYARDLSVESMERELGAALIEIFTNES
jgi:hypothetical protein